MPGFGGHASDFLASVFLVKSSNDFDFYAVTLRANFSRVDDGLLLGPYLAGRLDSLQRKLVRHAPDTQ